MGNKALEIFMNVFETVQFSVILVNSKGIISYSNSALEKMFGYTKEDLVGKDFVQLDSYPKELIKKFIDLGKIVLVSEVPEQLEFEAYKKDRSLIWVTILLTRIKLGDETFFQVIIQDITKQKEAEKALRESEALRKNEEREARQKLKESEEKYRNLFENSPNSILIVGMDGTILDCNSVTTQNIGYQKDELIGRSFQKLAKIVHSDYLPLIAEKFEMLRKGSTPKPFEIQIFHKNGTLFWILIGISLVQVGNKSFIQAIIQNITERKKTELKLRESEEKFRIIAEQSLMGILILQDGKFKYVNEAVANISGYSIQEIMDWPSNYFNKLIHPDDAPFVMNQLMKKQSGEPNVITRYSSRIYTKTGKLKWITQYLKSIIYQGKIADLITLIDITERKKAEKRLRESEEHFRTISEQALMGICIIQDGIIKYLNHEFANLFGYSIEEMMNWKRVELLKAVFPADRNMIIEKEKMKHQQGISSSIQYTFRGIKKNGEIVWLDNYSKIIEYRGRSADLIMVTNITARIKAEENLRKSESQYREAYTQAEFYKDLLSHDLSNILQGIIFSAETALINLENEKILTMKLNDIKDQVKRSARIISSVRKLSKLEKGPPYLYPVEAIDVIRRSIDVIKKGIYNKKLDVTFETFSEKIYIRANEFLRDIFENILHNAIKYNNNWLVKVHIRISQIIEESGPLKEYIKFELMDNGIGVKDQYKKAIFERGYREGGDVHGRGLGLSLSMKIISSYKGKIWVEDKVKGDYTQGSNFIILIPEAKGFS
ncbi:MAG: sensor histidine kinase [Candidatus Helarchaeota archaeon]